MSFQATFKAGNIEANVLGCKYNLHQEVDYTGRPSSVTRGGIIHLVIESTEETDLFEWMCNNFERKDGSVAFAKRADEGTLKELKFKEGYLVGYTEHFSSDVNSPMHITIKISAREIMIGSGSHINDWV